MMDVRLPNGVIISNVPEGATRADVLSRAQAAGLMQTQEVPETAPEPEEEAGSFIDPVMQGLTFGWADELRGMGAGLGRRLAGAPEERIQRARERETAAARASLEAFRERNPWTSLGLEVGGSLATGVPLLRGATALGSAARLSPGTSMVLGGAGEGAIAGAGAADEEKLLGAALGGAGGAAMSGIIPALSYGARAGMAPLTAAARRLSEEPTTTASRILSENLYGAGVTPTLLRARQRQLGPEAMLSDIAGEPGVALGQQVLQAERTGIPLATARRVMGERGRRSTGRLRQAIGESTGVSARMQPTLDAIRSRQRQASGALYDAAYRHDIPLTSKLSNLLQRPPMRRAFEEAKEAAATRGEDLPPFFQMDEFGDWQRTGVLPDMQAWDRMKQGVGRLIDSETDAITGRMTPKGRDLSKLKRELVEELDAINPDYAQARRVFAGDEALQNAMRDGERFLNMKTRDVERLTKDMVPSQREAFLTGAVEAIREKMGRVRSGEIGEFRFLETGNAKEKLRNIFPPGRQGTQQLNGLLRALRRERTFATTQNQLVGGSQTALRQAAGRAMETGVGLPTTTEAITSPVRGTLQAALRGASQQLSGISERSVTELANLMFDPGNVEAVITEMQRRGIPQETINQFVNRFSMGSAALSPAVGLLGGEIANQ